MLIPKSVIQEVESICRAFLWSGIALNGRKGKIAWSDICLPKTSWGLGLRVLGPWNVAMLAKLLWAIQMKEDRLWIKWVDEFYLQDGSLWEVEGDRGSWGWKNLMKVRKAIRGFVEVRGNRVSWLGEGKFFPQSVYRMLVPQPKPMPWWRLIWSRPIFPRHSFVLWLASRGKLSTKDRMSRFGIPIDGLCVLCTQAEETHDHLFCCCDFAKEVLGGALLGVKLRPRTYDWCYLMQWLLKVAKGKSGRAGKTRQIFAAVIYGIWMERNVKIFQETAMTPGELINKILRSLDVEYIVADGVE
ncbi:hypothetical protein Dimus_039622 [Dionaea muscipula]